MTVKQLQDILAQCAPDQEVLFRNEQQCYESFKSVDSGAFNYSAKGIAKRKRPYTPFLDSVTVLW